MADLPQALSLAALVAGALEYAILVRHREDARAKDHWRDVAAETGLQGLVRVFLAGETSAPTGTYQPE